ncbi:MAG: hypothetical protein OXM55_06780 [Bdellovibrionales bacterium]|nr:hypothetical protein [Bdellovibrionales bacterium]
MQDYWQKKLNLSETDYNEWKNTVQEESFAVWALHKNKINIQKYMEWAIQYYKIPFLTDSFFYNMTIHQQFWNRVKALEQWNETFLPVYEWNAILFAGCIEPPKRIQDKSTLPILASPKNLKFFWHKIQKLSEPDILYKKKDYPTEPRTQAKEEQDNFLTKSGMLLNTIIKSTVITQIPSSYAKETYDHIFALSKQYFTGIIIFSFNDNEFTPVEWSDSMSGPTIPVKTDKPSIFKMLFNTRSPYHGSIFENEQHKSFFTPWGFKVLPKHVTLVPIFNNSKAIVGAYMGISDKSVDTKHLHKITKWANTLSKSLQKVDKQYKNPSAS